MNCFVSNAEACISVTRRVGRSSGIAQLRAYFLDVQDRMKVRVIPGAQFFSVDVEALSVDSGALPS